MDFESSKHQFFKTYCFDPSMEPLQRGMLALVNGMA